MRATTFGATSPRMTPRPNPTWGVGSFSVVIVEHPEGWSYSINLEDEKGLDSGVGYPTEDAALRSALEDLDGFPDGAYLQAGVKPFRSPDWEGLSQAVWFPPADLFGELESLTEVDGDRFSEYRYVHEGDRPWARYFTYPDPAIRSQRLRAAVGARDLWEHGGESEWLTEEEFENEFKEVFDRYKERTSGQSPSPNPSPPRASLKKLGQELAALAESPEAAALKEQSTVRGRGWTTGGCWAFARAFHRWARTGELVALWWDSRVYEPSVAHVVVQLGPLVFDAQGAVMPRSMVRRWMRWFSDIPQPHVTALWLAPFDPKAGRSAGIKCPGGLVDHLVVLMTQRLGAPGDWGLEGG